MKARDILLLVVIVLVAGCAKEAEAGDPLKPRRVRAPRLLSIQQPAVAQPVQLMQTTREEIQVEVQKTRMVPVEKTITVMEPECYTCVETQVVERQVPVQMMAVAAPRAVIYKKDRLRNHTCIIKKIAQRIQDRKAARPERTEGFGLER